MAGSLRSPATLVRGYAPRAVRPNRNPNEAVAALLSLKSKIKSREHGAAHHTARHGYATKHSGEHQPACWLHVWHLPLATLPPAPTAQHTAQATALHATHSATAGRAPFGVGLYDPSRS